MRRLLRPPGLWFSFSMPVGQVDYTVSGVLLVAVKYGLDEALLYFGTGSHWSPWNYVQPLFNSRFEGAPSGWWIWALACVTIPFLWIGASMTVRRCLDAGLRPAIALLFFVPIINWIFMIALCFAQSVEHHPEDVPDPWTDRRAVPIAHRVRAAATSAGVGAAIGLGMLVVSVLLLERYGLTLFVGSPFVLGSVSAYLFGRRTGADLARTFGVVMLALLIANLVIVLFALEGLLCLVMASPLALALAGLGALLGHSLARVQAARSAPVYGLLLALPLLLVGDVAPTPRAQRVTRTMVEIDAPIERVFARVVSFPDLPPPQEWLFRTGIAYPTGAAIDGRGVGATRLCRFSTGTFVEPITAWEEPSRLAFDVVAQPLPMQELSPWDRVWAPHLESGFVSRRGEFRLAPLPGNRTRLEGSTWYELSLEPAWYWTLWSDVIVHAIHGRVLEHAESLAEDESRPQDSRPDPASS